ncbi:ParA family protein [Collinsella sp. UBA1693]|uniref:ParA family protein n=1 Tax=Collinsella sp. UBA1693 TaxID=1946385 RepID=UPI00257D665B|nr:ParA family protein [Collinsella sp. UBA1693]
MGQKRKHTPTITVVNQKGGVGKTFIADEIAWGLERESVPCAFLNFDKQGGTPHEESTPEERRAADVFVIDTPAGLMRQLHDLLVQTDVVVIPTETDDGEVPATEYTMSLVECNCPDAVKVLVVNKWTRFNAARDFEAHVDRWREKGWAVFYVPETVLVRRGKNERKSVVALAKRSRVAEAVGELTRYVIEAVGAHA